MLRALTNTLLSPFGLHLLRIPRSIPKSDTRKHSLVELLAQTEGMTSVEEAIMLYDLAREVTEGCIMEVGSYRGRSTVALGKGSLDGHQLPVFAIDPHENFVGLLGGQFGPEDRAAFYRVMLSTECYRIVRLVNLSSEVLSKGWNRKIALLWIDGDHSYEGVKRDFECWEPHLLNNAVLAFDDSLNHECGVYKVVEDLLAGGRYVKRVVVGKVTVLVQGDNST